MGRRSSGADRSACYRVLPIIDEESESESEGVAPETKASGGIAERRKAIVSRMRGLLRRAAAQSLGQSKLRGLSTLATAKKWRKRVVSFQINSSGNRGASRELDDQRLIHGDDGMSLSSSVSSKKSFSINSWGIAAAATASPASSPLCPAFASAETKMSDEMEAMASRMAQWITTDCDFAVLEL